MMQNVKTVFFQGNHGSRAQAARYAGKQGLDIYVSDGQTEHVFVPHSPRLLYNLFQYPELNDVAFGWSWNPWHLLFMILHFIKQWCIGLYGNSCMPHNIWSRMNVGGEEDVAQAVLAIKSCIKTHPTKQIVLFGTSRGASTILVSLTKLTIEELDYVSLIIVEAPFASVSSVLQESLPFAWCGCLTTWALEYFGQYKHTQTSPLDAVTSKNFPLNKPLVFVTSNVDKTVPVKNTMLLIHALEKCGHTALHQIDLWNSHHSTMSLSNKEDIAIYENQLHALYNRYIKS